MTLRTIAVILYTVCIQQVCGVDDSTTGYVGLSVILKSGADKTWILTRVQWSIYENTTYIASLSDREVLTERFWRHKGRLELNSKTGDLTIKNLRMDDSMAYTVALVNSNNARKDCVVQLKVQERLKKPHIYQMFNSLKDGLCHIVLRCDQSDNNVQLSWTPSDWFDGSYISGNTNITGNILWMSFGGNRNVTFGCIASNGQQNETKQITVGCTEEIKVQEVCSSCSCALMVILSILFTALGLLYACKGKLKSLCEQYSFNGTNDQSINQSNHGCVTEPSDAIFTQAASDPTVTHSQSHSPDF